MTPKETFNKTRKLTLGAVATALVVIVLYLIPLVPTNTLSLYALSSFFVSVIVIEAGIFYGWVFYVASSLLGLAVIPDKTAIIPYISFFGLYGLLKYYIERIRYIYVQYVIKFACFNLFLAAIYLFMKELAFSRVKMELPVLIIASVLELVFILYDYVYTLFIQYYRKNLRRLLKL